MSRGFTDKDVALLHNALLYKKQRDEMVSLLQQYKDLRAATEREPNAALLCETWDDWQRKVDKVLEKYKE